jgi:hypothetical protein
MPGTHRVGFLATCALLLITASAKAAPIYYVFTATGNGSVGGSGGQNAYGSVSFTPDTGGTPFSSFTITVAADNSAVTGNATTDFSNNATATTFSAGTLSGTFTLPSRVTESTTNTTMIFGENQPSPVFFVAEGLSASLFATYDLTTATALTPGTASVIPQIFSTSAGDLEIDTISSISFQAFTPEPGSAALLGAAAMMAARRRRVFDRPRRLSPILAG